MEFKYRVSVIIPIYNSEKYLEWGVNSVLQDQGPHEDYEVVLVDDGSTDSSPQICDKFAAEYENVLVIHKENEKLSATRNRGMREASGKYFCFLDSDDALLPNTINKVADFFDEHYEEVDLVTYPQVDILRNGTIHQHFRYDILKESGVYDLRINPYITQTRVNVFAKNKGKENNVYFDTTPGFRHEDSCYNTYVLKEKMKIGYCKAGGYIYALNNDNITANYFYAYYIYETSMRYYEQLFDAFPEGKIPAYVQAVVLNDLGWKFRSNKLYPYHYEKEELKKAKERVRDLISRIDVRVIRTMPNIDLYHRMFFLKLHKKCVPEVICDSRKFGLFVAGRKMDVWKNVGVNIQKVAVTGNRLKFYAAVKHPVCTFKNVEVWVKENQDDRTLRKIETTDSTYSYNGAKEKVTDFRRFVVEWDIDETQSVEFLCKIDDFFYPAAFTNTMNSPFDNGYGRSFLIKGNYYISYQKNILFFEKLGAREYQQKREEEAVYYVKLTKRLKEEQKGTEEKKKKEEEAINELKKNTSIFTNVQAVEEIVVIPEDDYDKMLQMRGEYLKLPKNRKIWLYNDANTNIENGLMQFRHDLEKCDGVERYYVYDNEFEEIKHHFRKNEMDKLVKFGSEEHRRLFIQSKMILTAYAQRNYYCPFKGKEVLYVQDLWDYKVVYLQHGILHATLPWQYGNDRVALDKIVVSSEFEKKNLVENYSYREEEIIDAGMVRLDYIDRTIKPKNRILIAPSWRHYLIGDIFNNRWTPQEGKFVKSEYYQEYIRLFNDSEFIKMLEKNDLYVDFKLHPIFECYAELFHTGSDRICLAPSAVELSDYRICITDFSSFVFDFVYCNKPILYFMPDYDKFCSGMHTYRQLDIPLEEGFGKLSITAEELTKDIQEIIDNDYAIPEKYQIVSDTFFTQYSNHAEDTYQALMKMEEENGERM